MRRVRLLPFQRWWRRGVPSESSKIALARSVGTDADGAASLGNLHRNLHRKIALRRTEFPAAIAYDSIEWHTAVEFPEELPAEAAATHIGMFVGWCIARGRISRFHVEENPAELDAVRTGAASPALFVLRVCEGIFWEEDLDALGNAFAADYYAGELGDGPFLHDYASILAQGLPSLYHVEDREEHRKRMRTVIDARFETWRRRQRSTYNALA